jgi:hypothetical protein
MADANGALNAVKKWGSSVAEGTGHFGLKCDLVNVNYEYEEQNVCAHHQTGHRRIDGEAADFSGRAGYQPGNHPNEQEFSKHYSVREPTALPNALVDAKPDELEPEADQQHGSDGSKKNHASRED